MARKAVIGVVVVFAYPLGGNLQGVLALGVLLLALVLHMYKQPFRNTKLNVLEAASLVVSALTFYLGIMFNDPKTSTLAEVIFSAFLFLVMVLFVTAAIYQVSCLQTSSVQTTHDTTRILNEFHCSGVLFCAVCNS